PFFSPSPLRGGGRGWGPSTTSQNHSGRSSAARRYTKSSNVTSAVSKIMGPSSHLVAGGQEGEHQPQHAQAEQEQGRQPDHEAHEDSPGATAMGLERRGR